MPKYCGDIVSPLFFLDAFHVIQTLRARHWPLWLMFFQKVIMRTIHGRSKVTNIYMRLFQGHISIVNNIIIKMKYLPFNE